MFGCVNTVYAFMSSPYAPLTRTPTNPRTSTDKGLKGAMERDKQQLRNEKERQRQQRDNERKRKEQQRKSNALKTFK